MNKHFKVSLLIVSLLLGGTGMAGAAYTSGGQTGNAIVTKFWPSK